MCTLENLTGHMHVSSTSQLFGHVSSTLLPMELQLSACIEKEFDGNELATAYEDSIV